MDNEGDLQESYRADYSSVELAFDLKNITLKMTSNQRDILKYLNCKETIKLLNQYPFEISNLRNDKDIVKESDSDETIKEYENLLRQLIKLYKEIDSI